MVLRMLPSSRRAPAARAISSAGSHERERLGPAAEQQEQVPLGGEDAGAAGRVAVVPAAARRRRGRPRGASSDWPLIHR